MDYVVGSIAALISGNVTPNRPKQLKKAQTPIKHQPSPNVTPKSEFVEDRSIFLSPTVQKKKDIIKKSPKRIFQNPDLDVTNGEELNSSVLSPKADKVKKHLKSDLEGDSSSPSILLSPKSPKNLDKSPNKANKKRLSGIDTKEADSLVETVFLSAKSLNNDDKSPKASKKRSSDVGNTSETMPKKKQRPSQNENNDMGIKLNETQDNNSRSTEKTPKKKDKRGNLVGEIRIENLPVPDISMKKIMQQNKTSIEETSTINGNESPTKKKKKRNKSQNRNSSGSGLTSNINSNSSIQDGEKVSEIKESDAKPSINASQNVKKKNKKRNKSKQNRNAENKASGNINSNVVTNENTKSIVSNETANKIDTASIVNQVTKKKNKKRNKSKQKPNNVQNESKINVNSDSVTNMEADSSIDTELKENKDSSNPSNLDNQRQKKKNKKRSKSKQKQNVQIEPTDKVSNMDIDSEDENKLENMETKKNVGEIENLIQKRSKNKKNKSKQINNDDQDESVGNEDVKVNPNAVTSQDTDSEHDSDDEIESEDEEINKKVLDTGLEADSSDEEPDAQDQKKAPSQMKDEQKTTDEASMTEEFRDLEEETRRTLFVGNVPFSNKCKRDIKKIFKQYGDVETVRIRTVPAKDARFTPKLAVIKNELHPDRTTVNIYVRFADESSVQKALAANNSLYNGYHLRVQPSDSPGAPHDARCSVFVGNLPFAMEDEALRAAFDKCGDIDSVRIVRDRKTQAGKGFGYVNFKSKDGVELALALTEEDLTVKNRILRVKRCTQATQNQLGRKQKVKNPGKNETGQTAKRNFAQNNRFGKKENFRPRQEHQGKNFGRGRFSDGRNDDRNSRGRFGDGRNDDRNSRGRLGDGRNDDRNSRGRFGEGWNDDKNSGAYRRVMNKRKNQDNSDGPPNKKQHMERDKKERKEFVGITAEKKRKNKFNKGQKKKKILSEILTK